MILRSMPLMGITSADVEADDLSHGCAKHSRAVKRSLQDTRGK